MSRAHLPRGYYLLVAAHAVLRHKADDLWDPAAVAGNPNESFRRGATAADLDRAARGIQDALATLKDQLDDRDADDALARINNPSREAA